MTGAGFLPVWTATMAAMMLPSTVPLLRLDRAAARSVARTFAIAGGYVSVWIALGVPVLVLDAAVDGQLLGMHGRHITAGMLTVAALYQVLPLRRRCLARCRAPLGRFLHSWRDGLVGAARMGVVNGVWCAGCCAGLMTALLGLGMMSPGWMAIVGAAIFVEKVTPVGVGASRAFAGVLAAGAVLWAT
jgi:predicted metal-binding membrane protein